MFRVVMGMTGGEAPDESALIRGRVPAISEREFEYQKEMPWLLQIPFPREGDVQPRITVIALQQTHKRRKGL